MFVRNVAMFRINIMMFVRNVAMFRINIVMFVRNVAMFRINIVMFVRNVAMFRINIVMFVRNVAMFVSNIPMFLVNIVFFVSFFNTERNESKTLTLNISPKLGRVILCPLDYLLNPKNPTPNPSPLFGLRCTHKYYLKGFQTF